MSRQLPVVLGIVTVFLAAGVQGQSALEIRAAATTQVPGWQPMTSPERDKARLWVSPTNHLTSVDIERAEPSTRPDGYQAITVVFTDEGARKMAELSAAQLNEPIAILLDGKVIWAPVVRDGIKKEAVLSGGPTGLTSDEIQRLLTSLKRR
jgi:preprotein translocase subunit SecD